MSTPDPTTSPAAPTAAASPPPSSRFPRRLAAGPLGASVAVHALVFGVMALAIPNAPMLLASAAMLVAAVLWLELLRRATRTRPRAFVPH